MALLALGLTGGLAAPATGQGASGVEAAARAETLARQGQWKDAYDLLAAARLADQQQMQQQRRQLEDERQHARQAQAVAGVLLMMLLAGVATLVIRRVQQSNQPSEPESADELTGLANRRALFAHAEQEFARVRAAGGKLSVLMFDVDHFHYINDTHGHAVGDEVLRHVAMMLATGLRERDKVGRVGGEEFITVLPGAGLSDAERVADRMRGAIAATPAITDAAGRVAMTVSVGVAQVESDVSVDALVARADEALQRAKRDGRNRVCLASARVGPAAEAVPASTPATISA